ncbi:DUF1800 domain-containing protein [Candidatus Thioglobus sp.]|nr:DUF1800 family protein [Candidatus Thioglobus sp.]MDA8981237.1 DUF1800 domain-containing protein [Candidatus Thioglobus sp.]
MNEQFRVAHKLGLMFRPETPLPDDVKNWAISQLKAKSPALGISQIGTKVKPWPQSLQPDLMERDTMFANWFQRNKIGDASNASNAERQANTKDNLMDKKDELKFSHRNVYGKDQIRLRFTAFWANHFTTGNTHDNRNHIGHAIDEAILANLNGDFSHMLYKMTSHPSMLIYLDNIFSAGPNSKEVEWAKRNGKQAGLNDNLGRELLELHTVSPSANYSEDDIRNAAKVLAGWGVFPGMLWGNNKITLKQKHAKLIQMAGTTNTWDFFKRDATEPGTKTVMGKVIPEGKGGLRKLTDFLASHEHTINHISFKLAQHFVSDSPSQSDIDYIANTWRKSNGDLDQIHSAVIERAISSNESKLQWPMTWLFQVIRLSDATFFKGWNQIEIYDEKLMETREIYEELGQSFWHTRQPNGYSSAKSEWISGEMFERRIRFSDAIYSAGKPSFNAQQIMSRIGANKTTRDLVNRHSGRKEQFIALMCSSELMGLENA